MNTAKILKVKAMYRRVTVKKRGIYAARMKILSVYATSLKTQERSAESGAAEKMATEKILKMK